METEDGYDPRCGARWPSRWACRAWRFPEEFGGSGYSYVELCVVLEEMGRRLLCAPFFSTVVLAANTLLHSGDDAAKAAHLPGIASGETIATLAFTEENGRWDEAGITDGGPPPATATLSGTKSYVLDGHTAVDHRRGPHRRGRQPVRRRR
jgi:alkylation response protein AidB-like acyl-CoA dehydrogenase